MQRVVIYNYVYKAQIAQKMEKSIFVSIIVYHVTAMFCAL